MIDDIDLLQAQYREAVRIHLWYAGSIYSVHQGKISKDQASTYRNVAHQLLAERSKKLQAGTNF